jgi:GNAT superfamily N-acetyltransferase
MIDVTVREWAPHEVEPAVGVLGRGYRDAPLSLAIYGDDPIRRLRSVERVMGRRISAMDPPPFVACRDDVIVGVCGMAPPGACQLTLSKQERAAAAGSGGSSSLMKTLEMAAEWDRHHPDEPHWHLGPVAVEPASRRNGVGGRMVERFCELVDEEGAMAFLETDRRENVRFFEQFGFLTVDEANVIGVQNWFMRREPKTGRSG